MKMLKFRVLIFFCVFLAAVVPAKASDLWLKNIPVEKLEKLYDDIGYEGARGYLMLEKHEYPRVFLKNFPIGYENISDEEKRAVLFIKILAPLALKINEDIAEERENILRIEQRFAQKKKLSSKEKNEIEKKAEKYDVFSRMTGDDRYIYLIDELLNRVDIIPPSIMIVAAAIETNWGASRVVKDGNSLYKKLVWHTKEGLKPVGETEDDSYRIKKYDNIFESMQEFALGFNSRPAYKAMRNFRRELKQFNNLQGMVIAPYVYGSSEMKNYAGVFDYTLAYYELMEIDKSSLADNMDRQMLGNKYKDYIAK